MWRQRCARGPCRPGRSGRPDDGGLHDDKAVRCSDTLCTSAGRGRSQARRSEDCSLRVAHPRGALEMSCACGEGSRYAERLGAHTSELRTFTLMVGPENRTAPCISIFRHVFRLFASGSELRGERAPSQTFAMNGRGHARSAGVSRDSNTTRSLRVCRSAQFMKASL